MLQPITKYVYIEVRNTCIDLEFFELNCSYYFYVNFEDRVKSYLRSCSADKLVKKPRKYIPIHQQNLLYTQELQKQAYDKGIKPCSYTTDNNAWLNNKYIKTKQNQQFETMFFCQFHVLHSIRK